MRLSTGHSIRCEAIAPPTNPVQDFAGQKLADTISTIMLVSFSVSVGIEEICGSLIRRAGLGTTTRISTERHSSNYVDGLGGHSRYAPGRRTTLADVQPESSTVAGFTIAPDDAAWRDCESGTPNLWIAGASPDHLIHIERLCTLVKNVRWFESFLFSS